jgi:hypothetical protein
MYSFRGGRFPPFEVPLGDENGTIPMERPVQGVILKGRMRDIVEQLHYRLKYFRFVFRCYHICNCAPLTQEVRR